MTQPDQPQPIDEPTPAAEIAGVAGPALVVGPDDTLVILLGEELPPHRFDQLVSVLSKSRPDLSKRVLFVGGARAMAVLRETTHRESS